MNFCQSVFTQVCILASWLTIFMCLIIIDIQGVEKSVRLMLPFIISIPFMICEMFWFYYSLPPPPIRILAPENNHCCICDNDNALGDAWLQGRFCNKHRFHQSCYDNYILLNDWAKEKDCPLCYDNLIV